VALSDIIHFVLCPHYPNIRKSRSRNTVTTKQLSPKSTDVDFSQPRYGGHYVFIERAPAMTSQQRQRMDLAGSINCGGGLPSECTARECPSILGLFCVGSPIVWHSQIYV
jgi:hypothetical protein